MDNENDGSDTTFLYRVMEVLSMYDGDSVNVRVVRYHNVDPVTMDFGFNDIVEVPGYTVEKSIECGVRMYGFDTMELRDKRPDWKAAAYLARDLARAWMEESLQEDALWMVTHKDEKGKYGRILANFHRGDDDTNTLMKYLMDNHLAVPYFGRSKDEIAASHAANIAILKANNMLPGYGNPT